MSEVNHAGVVVDLNNINSELIRQAMAAVRQGGKLDVLLQPLPGSISEAERILRNIYALAPANPMDLDFTVIFDDSMHRNHWEREFRENNQNSPSTSNTIRDSSLAKNEFSGKFDTVAVGGTWDHMHWGHRLMLTMAAYTARSTLIIGVTASELLVNKKYAEFLDSYEKRVAQSEKFVKYLCPHIRIDSYPLHELYGPTIVIKSIEALVVSAETSKGADQINTKRLEMGWPSLTIIEVGLIPGSADGKLSSTDLRLAEMEKTKKKKKEGN